MIAELIQTVKEEKKLLASVIADSKDLSKKDKVLSRYGLSENQIEDFDYGSKVDEQLNQFCQKKIIENTTEEERFMSAWEKLGFVERNLLVKKLGSLGEADLAQRLSEKIVMFSDILKLPDSVIKNLLKKTDRAVLKRSLCSIHADSLFPFELEKIRGKIYSNMEHSKVEVLKEDLYFMGPVRKRDILEARREVCRLLENFVI
ncbi:FliG C-terminal domain-containing protein [Treponema sp.]|uniref:FliG C-terminal domain-containing protein n=1 Tax=Treponema sp. TaxID=166 RepID=UPI00298E044E|nr:FliG C-terminal domain-containing protein [Treponema sp.]MCQ2242263.1 hypothetical protein [Treponema sp.]